MAAPRPDLPADALVLLMGPSGAGKSTWAARHFRADEILSSDRFREMVAADATDQSATADAFKVLHAIARARMRRGT
jgi:protein phosphatase